VLFATATFGLDSARSGLLLSAFGLANMLSAAPAGVLVDRLGSTRVSGAGALGAALVLSLLPFAPHPVVIGALLLAGGASTAALWAGLSKAAVQAAPSRRATASSLFNAWKFVGYAVAPLAYAPLYTHAGARVTFAVAAAASLLILLPLASLRRSAASPTASWSPQATLPRPSNLT
jgi:MFS family permease